MAEPDNKAEEQPLKSDQQELEVSPETPLIESVSEDVSVEVGEFMEQAAQQNEAAAEAVPDIRNKPGPYISFQHVDKSFGEFVVLEDVSFYVLPGETLCILGRSGVGKSVSLQMLLGFLKPDSLLSGCPTQSSLAAMSFERSNPSRSPIGRAGIRRSRWISAVAPIVLRP